MLSRSTLGFKFNTVGANKHAARYAGIDINRIVTLSMVLGGGLAGLAGALEAEGTLFRFEPAVGGTLGFDGITIALLARANPLATIPAAFLVGVLRTGAAGPAVRDRHRARGGRRAARDDPALRVDPGARQVDLPQPRRQGQRRIDELGELT
jgi:branched-subunit amino acid ABC-type transport system permease component